MAASKEARVPFVDISLFQYMYRKSYDDRIVDSKSKYPLIKIAERLNLFGAINRKKIGFSATLSDDSRALEYSNFQKFCLERLNW